MGFFFSKLWNNLLGKKEIRILMLGLDASGKTTILHKRGKEEKEKVKILPTIGFYVESLDYKDWNFITFDLGGADKMRLLFRHYYQNTEGIIYVVDSNDRDRIEKSNMSDFIKNIYNFPKSHLIYFFNEDPQRVAAIIYALVKHPDLLPIFEKKFN